MAVPLHHHRWLPFVFPFLVYMGVGAFEPEASPPTAAYAVYYAIRIGLTVAAVILFLPAYRTFPLRVTLLSVLVGVVGAGVWIGLSRLHVEESVLQWLGLDWRPAPRAAYDPLTALGDTPITLAAFLTVRFFGLVCVVPWIEEFFLRGFVVRFVIDPDWWAVPIGRTTRLALGVVIVYAVLTHPAEAVAAAVWFSLITWLVYKTRSIWDAVMAHAITNLLLGMYIVAFRDWALW